MRTAHEQIIDEINLDKVTATGFETNLEEKARKTVESFEQFIRENRNEIIALRIFYDQPYQRRTLSFKMIKELREKLLEAKPALAIATVWEAYKRLENRQISNPATELTTLVALVRRAIGLDGELTDFSVTVNKNKKNFKGKSVVICHYSSMEELKNITDFDRDLLVKYICNEVNDQEKSMVESWLNQSAENYDELEELQKMLLKVDTTLKVKRFDTETAWQNVHSKITQSQKAVIQLRKKRKEALLRFYKYAAVILIAILVGSVGFYLGFKNQTKVVYGELISANDQVVNEYTLPDGTIVALNSNSQLTFPKHFNDNIREVTISGEAFFDVTPNPEKPFVIHAGNAQVKVLGTSFNVCAYPETETVEVVVKTGKVQVLNRNMEAELSPINEVFLTPGEKGTLYLKRNLLEKSENRNPNYLAWKTHDFIFEETPLNEVIQCLEKVYHVKIIVAEPELNNLLLNARFDKKPVDFVLDVVRLTFNLELSGDNEQFTLSSRKKEQNALKL